MQHKKKKKKSISHKVVSALKCIFLQVNVKLHLLVISIMWHFCMEQIYNDNKIMLVLSLGIDWIVKGGAYVTD